MPSFSHTSHCGSCRATLTIAATAADSKVATTAFSVVCPVCGDEVRLEVTLSLDPSTVDVIGFERAATCG
jgi:hypothetical protein